MSNFQIQRLCPSLLAVAACPNVLDGTQWSLELRYGECKVKGEGGNLYRGSTGIDYSDNSPFAQFLRALATLTGQPEIAPDPSP